MTSDRFDPAIAAISRDRDGLPLILGNAVMADPDHLIIPSIRPDDGEERFKAVRPVDGKLYTAVSLRRDDVEPELEGIEVRYQLLELRGVALELDVS